MQLLQKTDIRILYILAKNPGPTRKQTISRATARWKGAERDAVLERLERSELINRQSTPAAQSKRAGNFYWLTEAGLREVTDLQQRGVVHLPEHWRQQHVPETDAAPERAVSDTGSG